MSEPTITDDVIAVHEAGHLIVGRFVGRRALKVSIDWIAGNRGCFWVKDTESGWDEFSEMRCLLAGARAQVNLRPDSVAVEKLPVFKNRIIQPSTSLWRIPDGIYDFTGWESDIRPVYVYLCMPNASVDDGAPHLTTRSQLVDRTEEVLLRFFSDTNVQHATRQIARELLRARFIAGNDAEHLVARQNVDFARGFLGQT